MPLHHRSRTWLPIAIFVSSLSFPLIVYYLTLAPDLSWAHGGDDGGDLIVAAYTLGVGHPPGYPAYTFLAHFITLLPWGSVAYRVNFLSAIGAAVAVGVSALIISTLNIREYKSDIFFGSLVAAWELAFMPLFWSQAVITEVYAVHAAFIALTIWLALYMNNRPTTWAALILGFVWGISLGFHMTSIFLFPIIIWGLSGHKEKQKTVIHWLSLSMGFGLAALQWLFIALRAGRGAVTWGDPTTLDGWWWMISGQLYKDYAFSFPLDRWFPRLSYLVNTWLTGFGPIAVLLGLIGCAYLVRRRSGLATALGSTAIAYIVFAIGYNTTDSNNYTIPALIIFCIIIGCGVIFAIVELRSRWGIRAVITMWIIMFVMLGVSVIINWPTISMRSDREAMLFGEKVMQLAPARAVLLTDEDRVTFSLWYFQYVLGKRTDTIIMDKGLLAFKWYQAQLGVSPDEAEMIVNHNEFYTSFPVCSVSIENQLPMIECLPDHLK